MTKPNRNQIYDAVIRRMVSESLMEKEETFSREHEFDPNEKLLSYLRQMAAQLEHTPWPKEIIGWQLITKRFGSWQEAVIQAGLPMMNTPNSPTKFLLYRNEVERQKIIYRNNRAEKKQKAMQRNKEKIQQRQEQTKNKKSDPENNPATVQIENE